MKSKLTYTIKDIADMAQVSRGTVDRVIHGRGTVSKKTYDKIKLILDKIDYQPNLVAQTLRKGELFKIAVLMPDSEYDIYWKRAIDGVNRVVKELSFVGVSVEMHLFNPFKELSFDYHAQQVLKGAYSGVLLAPVFYSEAIQFFKECKAIKLPYVTFNTNVDQAGNISHVGQDLLKSGRTAASLLLKIVQKNDEFLVVHIDEDISNARHIKEKEDGFVSFLKQNGIDDKSIHVLKVKEPYRIEKQLIEILEKQPEIKGVFVSTSKVYYVADVIKAYSLKLALVGYDLIKENVVHLNDNRIDFLIYQNPGLQSGSAMSLLVDHLVFKKEVPEVKHLPIEIVIKENHQDYILE